MKKNTMKQGIFLLCGFVLAGCSNPLGEGISRVDTNFGPAQQSFPAPTGFEAVSGSRLGVTSSGQNHRLDLTVGSSSSEVRVVTNQNKVLYLSVQGQLISQ